jgi:P27 family predicted phage terminase small subunit
MARTPNSAEVKLVRGRKARPEPHFHGPLHPPANLSPVALDYWRVYAEVLESAAVAGRADSIGLATLCEICADEERIAAAVRLEGDLVTNPSGRRVPHPLAATLRGLRDQKVRLLTAFGLLPDARQKVTVGRKADEGDAIARKYFT